MPPLRLAACSALILGFIAAPAFAQRAATDDSEWLARCREQKHWRDHPRHCEVKDAGIAAPAGTLTIGGRQNGGISVVASPRADVLIRSRIQTQAPSEAEALDIARLITIVTGADAIHTEGPGSSGDTSWSVSYVVELPATTDLELTTHNGPISVDGMRSRIEMTAHNGPISLRRAAGGDIRGRATNGPISVDLDGARRR